MLYEVNDEGIARPSKPVRAVNEALELQRILARNLFLLPGDQIDPEEPRRWLLVREEMPVPDPGGGGSRWSVDLLLTDQSGIPTLVECKRYADTRSRREVVGQMLEYAANGHYYWDRSDIRRFIEETAEMSGRSADEVFSDLETEEFEGLEELLDRFVENLREGQVRLVFFMEEAPQELKSIVDFLNRQTERSEVLIVEARQYDVDGRRFVVPALFGYTEEARRAKRSVHVAATQSRRKWTEAAFFSEAVDRLPPDQVELLRRVLATAREVGLEVRLGSGVKRGSFSLVAGKVSSRSFVSFLTDGLLTWNFSWLDGGPEVDEFRRALLRTVQDDLGFTHKGDEKGFWSYHVDEWFPHGEALVRVIRNVGEGLRA